MRRLARIAPAGALLAGGVACAGFELGELPREPIAFVYRSSEQGQERAELLDPKARPEVRPGAHILRGEALVDVLTGDTPQRALIRTFGRMVLLDPHTLEITRLGFATQGARPLEWSADHRNLRFLTILGPRPQVMEYDSETGEVRKVTARKHPHPSASISVEGRVAFARITGKGKEGRSRIWVTKPGGGSPRPVTLGPGDFRPTWSPDGRQFVFGTLLAGNTLAIASVDPDRDAPPRIIGRGRDPVFTPDGAWIVYCARLRGHWRLWRMRPDGTGKGAIGARSVRGTDELMPAVSPDSRYVVYVARDAGRERLRVRRLDGSGDRPLLEGGDGSSPVW